MKRLSQVSALPFLALGIFMIWESTHLKYYTTLGPGAGFLPFWVGTIMTVLSLIWLGQVSFRPAGLMPGDFIPDRHGTRRVISIIAALIVCTVLLDRLGFCLTMLGFLTFLLLTLGRQSLVVTLIIAVAGSVGVYYIFGHWLGVFLPRSPIAVLNSLGL